MGFYDGYLSLFTVVFSNLVSHGKETVHVDKCRLECTVWCTVFDCFISPFRPETKERRNIVMKRRDVTAEIKSFSFSFETLGQGSEPEDPDKTSAITKWSCEGKVALKK